MIIAEQASVEIHAQRERMLDISGLPKVLVIVPERRIRTGDFIILHQCAEGGHLLDGFRQSLALGHPDARIDVIPAGSVFAEPGVPSRVAVMLADARGGDDNRPTYFIIFPADDTKAAHEQRVSRVQVKDVRITRWHVLDLTPQPDQFVVKRHVYLLLVVDVVLALQQLHERDAILFGRGLHEINGQRYVIALGVSKNGDDGSVFGCGNHLFNSWYAYDNANGFQLGIFSRSSRILSRRRPFSSDLRGSDVTFESGQ